MHQFRRVALRLAKPCRPIGLIEDHRHTIVQPCHLYVRAGRDDRIGPQHNAIRPFVASPQARKRHRLPILPGDGEGLLTALHGFTFIKRLGGEGRTVEVDGAYFGGYVKPANLNENRRDRRLAKNQSGKREIVIVVRERERSTLPAVFNSESAALGWISSRVAKGTALVADGASSWNGFHNRYEISRIDHQQAYSLNGVYSNGAESFFSRLRRAEMGHHHHVAGPYLVRYAQESAGRENKRRVSNGDQVQQTVSLALASRPSVDFCGYWQRHKAA